MKVAAAIFVSFAAAASFGDGAVVRMPAGWASAPDREEGPAKRKVSAAVLPPSMRSVTSRDNFVEVFTDEIDPPDGVGFKGPVFKSAVEQVDRIASASGLAMPRGQAGLVIHVGDGTNEDARVVARVERSRSGGLVTRIYLPSPGFSDLDAFGREIAAAYLRAWVSRTSDAGQGGKAADPGEAPAWVALGLSRATDEDFALFDRLDALARWQAGEMPFFPNAPAELDPSTDRGASFCGFAVKWMMERRVAPEDAEGRGKRKIGAPTVLRAMMERLAAGGKWDDSAVVGLLSGEKDPQLQDAAFDAHMWKLKHAVLVPGQSTPEDVTAFSSRLLLYPPFFDISFRNGAKACPFRLAVRNASDPAVRVAAFVKMRTLELTVIGRGERLVKAAGSFSRFLKALALGEDKPSLTEKLDEAEALLGAAYEEAVDRFGT